MFLKGILGFLPWLIFFGLIWFLMMRQIQGAGNKALSFGKSRAKLSPETKKKYTYADVAGADEAKEELKEFLPAFCLWALREQVKHFLQGQYPERLEFRFFQLAARILLRCS
jgi:hypothetical protein